MPPARCTRDAIIVERTERAYLSSIFPKSERSSVFRPRKMHEKSVREEKLPRPFKCSCKSLPPAQRKQCCARIVSRVHVPRFVTSGGRQWGALDEHQHQTGSMELAVCRLEFAAPRNRAKQCAKVGAVATKRPVLSCKKFKAGKK